MSELSDAQVVLLDTAAHITKWGFPPHDAVEKLQAVAALLSRCQPKPAPSTIAADDQLLAHLRDLADVIRALPPEWHERAYQILRRAAAAIETEAGRR